MPRINEIITMLSLPAASPSDYFRHCAYHIAHLLNIREIIEMANFSPHIKEQGICHRHFGVG
jgi:hypothetical protein